MNDCLEMMVEEGSGRGGNRGVGSASEKEQHCCGSCNSALQVNNLLEYFRLHFQYYRCKHV